MRNARAPWLIVLLCAATAGAEPAGKTESQVPVLAEIPSGTLLSVELVDPINTGKNKAGDPFRGRILEGVWIRGAVAIPPGTTVRGALTKVTPSGRLSGRSQLEMTLRSVEIEDRSYDLSTDTLSYAGDSHTGQNIGSWLGGALQGALYGVLFGGGKGAVIGAGAGAAAGGAATVIKGKADVDFEQGAKLMFEAASPFKVPAYAQPSGQAEQKAPAASSSAAAKPSS